MRIKDEGVSTILGVSEEAFDDFLKYAQYKSCGKHEVLFSPDRVSRKLLYIKSGILRGFKIVNGKDYTHHFFMSNWFATDYQSYLKEQSGTLFIESLTPVEYYQFDKEVLNTLYSLNHSFEKIGRVIAERAFLSTVEKLNDIQTLELKDRYKSLIERNPGLFQSVPQKYIASYLGVSEQSLSRIKHQLIS